MDRTLKISTFLFVVFTFSCFNQLRAQEISNKLLLKATFSKAEFESHSKRKFLKIGNQRALVKLNPLSYLGAGLLYFYQNVISEQFSADCSYQVSCSENAKKAIEKFGLIKGILIGANQLNSCFPNVSSEHSDHAISNHGKVIVQLEDYE